MVAGDASYEEAAAFMQMLMPSHAKNVSPYKEPTPLFTRYGVERQLNAMFQPQVTLRSGGYIVINQTEALVAIDVNSGKSTREFSIEETALATNAEAADEIARQLKLRDLAGLIVIDFIDMEEKRNNRTVERRLKDALRFDRARIQLGRISAFRFDGNVAPTAADRRARGFDLAMPPLSGNRHYPLDRECRTRRIARSRRYHHGRGHRFAYRNDHACRSRSIS